MDLCKSEIELVNQLRNLQRNWVFSDLAVFQWLGFSLFVQLVNYQTDFFEVELCFVVRVHQLEHRFM